MNIACKACGYVMATRSDTHIKVKGENIPTQHLDGVILRCNACSRTKTYYLKSAKKPVNTAQNGKLPDIVLM